MRARTYEFQSNTLLLSNSSVPGSLVIKTHGSLLVFFFSSAMFLLCLRLGTAGLIIELTCQCPQNSLVLGLYLIASLDQREQV